MSEDGPKIQIDSDWKAEAQREKERLAQQAKAKAASSAQASPGAAAGATGGRAASSGPRELPPASFETLMGQLATQAMMYLGAYADPRTGQPMLDLDVARHHIDLLGVLEEKTQGNLKDDEARALAAMLYELRSRYVQVANAARQK